MPARVRKRNTPPKIAPAGAKKPTLPKSLLHEQILARLSTRGVHPKSQVRVRMTMIDQLFGERSTVRFGIRDIVFTMADDGKPDLVEIVVG